MEFEAFFTLRRGSARAVHWVTFRGQRRVRARMEPWENREAQATGEEFVTWA